MKVVFCIPAMEGGIKTRCHQSLVATYRILHAAGIEYEEFVVENCPYLPTARNTLAAMFLDSDGTDLFFIDSDVGFDPSGVVKILERSEGIVAGIYPLKRDFPHGYPVEVKTEDGIPIGRDGLIEADFLPTGFMRIKRICFESLKKAYPELKYADSVVEILGAKVSEAWDFFHMGIDQDRQRWTTEDYAFCQRWRDIGGHLWVYPDIEFEHVGQKAWKGNYHRFLLRQPGGAYARLDLTRATAIEGWMTTPEMEWLAHQALQHERIVEIGSYHGRSTRAMADNTKGVIYAVDNWHGPPGVEMPDEVRAAIWEKFQANLQDHIQSAKVIPYTAEHSEMEGINLLFCGPEQRADMVFIDGAHDREAVERDIRIWKARIAPSGLLCGHDVNWIPVADAVSELLPGVQVVSGTSIWFWKVPAKEPVDVPKNDGEGRRLAAQSAG